MNSLSEIVSHPLFTLLAFFVSLASLVMAFDYPKQIVETKIHLPSLRKSYWKLLLAITFVTTEYGIVVRFDMPYAVIVGLVILIASLLLLNQQSKQQLEKLGHKLRSIEIEKDHQSKLLLQIHRLHAENYIIHDWRVTYTINEEGTGHTEQEITIRSHENTVYFHTLRLGINSNVEGKQIIQNLNIINIENNQKLQFLVLKEDYGSLELAIVLDPPAKQNKPVIIKLECTRPNLFEPLVTNLEDYGELRVGGFNWSKVNNLELRFIAPNNLTFESFSVSPKVGNVKIGNVSYLSGASWKVHAPENGTYTYRLTASRKS